jgi:hypothetical protein
VHLVLKDGTREGAPRFRFEIHSKESDPATGLRYIHMSVPATWALARLDAVEALFRTTAADSTWAMGAAGLGFDCSRFDKAVAESHAHAAALAHPALSVFVDRVWMTRDEITTGGGFPGVRWLTFLGPEACGRVAESALGKLPAIESVILGAGLLLRAGGAPTVDGAELRGLAGALAPLLRSVTEGSMWLDLEGGCDAARMFVYFTRLLDLPALKPLRKACGAAMSLHAAGTEEIERAMRASLEALDTLAKLEENGAAREPSGITALGIGTLRTAVLGEVDLAIRKTKDLTVTTRLRATMLARADAPDALFAALRVREEPSYVFSGALQDALDANELEDAAALAARLPRWGAVPSIPDKSAIRQLPARLLLGR